MASQHDIPAPGFTLTKGRTPRTGEKPLRVQFANSYVDEKWTYRAAQLRWDHTGSDWDIIAVKRAE